MACWGQIDDRTSHELASLTGSRDKKQVVRLILPATFSNYRNNNITLKHNTVKSGLVDSNMVIVQYILLFLLYNTRITGKSEGLILSNIPNTSKCIYIF